MLIIPVAPEALYLPIGRLWDGSPSPDSRISAMVQIQQIETGIRVVTQNAPLPAPHLPDVPEGTRVSSLDGFDRLEIFFVDEEEQYLHIQLSQSGQSSIAGFDGVRNKVADFDDIDFSLRQGRRSDGQYVNEIIIPLELFPENLKATNVFLISGKQTLAYYPLSTNEDTHQPSLFPFVKLAEQNK